MTADPRPEMLARVQGLVERCARLPNSMRALSMLEDLCQFLLAYKANRRGRYRAGRRNSNGDWEAITGSK